MDGLRYRQDGNDAVSVHRWVAKLRKLDCILDYHQAGDPHDSIDSEDFSLIIQTPWQRRIFAETGEYVLCMDGTHNTQVYGYTLFTLLSRDKYGHGQWNFIVKVPLLTWFLSRCSGCIYDQ